MPFLDAAQAAALVGSTVRMATLVELQFASQTMRLWNGAGSVTVAGMVWQGLGTLGSVDGLEQTREPVSHKITLRLAGVSAEVLAIALNSTTDVQGRLAYVWAQLFDAAWQPLGARIPLFWGVMQRLSIEREAARDREGGVRIAALEVENVFAGRSRPQAGRWTDPDQKARHGDDAFCRFVPLQRSQTVVWPDY